MATETGAGSARQRAAPPPLSWTRSNAWTDMALTVPVFVAYHLGVVALDVRNAADLVTAELSALAAHDLRLYWGLTVCIGLSLIAVLATLGRGQAFELRRFAYVAVEGVVYAVAMRGLASAVVGALPLGPAGISGRWAGFVMSCGAGFYEELLFRAIFFGGGALLIKIVWGKGIAGIVLLLGWAFVAAAAFSGWHHVGALGDAWDVRIFVFRMVCGLAFTAIYVTRGFAPAVWTHALYDVWVLAL